MPAFGYGGSYQPQSATPVQGNPGSRASYQALQAASVNAPAFGIDPNKQNEQLQIQRTPGWDSMNFYDPNSPYNIGRSGWGVTTGDQGNPSNVYNDWGTYSGGDMSKWAQISMIPGSGGQYSSDPISNPLKKWDQTLEMQNKSLTGQFNNWSNPQWALTQTKTGPSMYSIENAIGDYQRYLTAYNELQKRGLGSGALGINRGQNFTPEARKAYEQNWQQFTSAVMPRYVQQGNLTFQSGRQL
jgi:hypothetical protein